MVKVGILSMQRIANYGSFLQAYGLKSMLEECGCTVQFVDYHPGETLIPSDGGTGIIRKVSKVFDAFRNSAPLKDKIRYISYKKNYASNYYPYLGLSENMNYAPEVDVLVIGSDEVFNCVQNNTNVGFSPELFGEGNNAKKLITYAASFGDTTVKKLEEYKVANKVRDWLKDFDTISVRDQNSGSIIRCLIGQEPEYHLDPVLVYDFIGKCTAITRNMTDSKYILLYGYSGRFSKTECKEIQAYAKSKSLKILCIGGIQDCCEKFIDCDPFKVISYFMNADYVITDTFHGTILSVVTHRQFATVVRSRGYGNSEKVTDLLDRLGLTLQRLDDFSMLRKTMDNFIDYKSVDGILKAEREKSYYYLNKQVRN